MTEKCIIWSLQQNERLMKIKWISLTIALTGLFLFSCDRNEEIAGCTHHLAENHDPRATSDDGSCTYSDEFQLLWKDGNPGGWNGNVTTYGIVPLVCSGAFESEADTSVQTIPGQIVTDVSGQAHVQFRLSNPRTARNYYEGYVRFEVLKPEGSNLETFFVYVHGKNPQAVDECGSFNRSQLVELSALALSSTDWIEVAVPFSDFNDIMLADIRAMFGVEVANASPETEVLQINNIRWTRF